MVGEEYFTNQDVLLLATLRYVESRVLIFQMKQLNGDSRSYDHKEAE